MGIPSPTIWSPPFAGARGRRADRRQGDRPADARSDVQGISRDMRPGDGGACGQDRAADAFVLVTGDILGVQPGLIEFDRPFSRTLVLAPRESRAIRAPHFGRAPPVSPGTGSSRDGGGVISSTLASARSRHAGCGRQPIIPPENSSRPPSPLRRRSRLVDRGGEEPATRTPAALLTRTAPRARAGKWASGALIPASGGNDPRQRVGRAPWS